MAERYLFFNSTISDPRTYQAQDFADYFGSVLSTGLLHTDEIPGMNVSVEQGTMNTMVSPGKAIIQGHLYENTAPLRLTHSIPEPGVDRIDRIVLRLDKRHQSRFIRLFVKQGEPSIDPAPPSLQRDDNIYEISLAQVLIRGGQSFISPADITDERGDETVCPWARSNVLPHIDAQDVIDLRNDFDKHKADEAAHGIDALKNALNRNFYDDYLRTLELYYTGHFGGNVIDGLRGMTFDGFINTDRVDLSKTDASLDIDNLEYFCKGSSISTKFRPSLVENISAPSTWIDSIDFFNTPNTYDSNVDTYSPSDLLSKSDYSSYKAACLRLTLPEIKIIAGIEFRLATTMQWGDVYPCLRKVRIGETLDKWTTVIDLKQAPVGESNLGGRLPGTSSPSYRSLTFGQVYRCKYIEIELGFSYRSESSGYVYLYDIQLIQGQFKNSIVQSKAKNVLNDVKEVTTFFTGEIPNGCNIIVEMSNNGGANWITAELVDSRPDPLVSRYTEYQYKSTFPSAGRDVVTKFTLYPNAAGTVTPKLKRYANMWGGGN